MAIEYQPMRTLIYVDVVKEDYRHKLKHWLHRQYDTVQGILYHEILFPPMTALGIDSERIRQGALSFCFAIQAFTLLHMI